MNDFLFFPVIFLVIFVLVLLIMLVLLGRREPEYGVKSVTLKGEEVRSFAEKRIADYFTRNNIKYVYEQEAKTKGWLFHNTISHPDFYLTDYDVYVEYWGLVDADNRRTRERYVKDMKRKMAIYYKNDIKFISIYIHAI